MAKLVKRLSFLLIPILCLALSAGCDSSNSIATVTTRANGTNTASAQLTPPTTPTPVPPTAVPTLPAPTAGATGAATVGSAATAPVTPGAEATGAATTPATSAVTAIPTAGATSAATSAATAAPTGAVTQAATIHADTGWLSDSIMYSLFVRSFRDSNGDGIGDLQGVIDGLDYLQSLGVDTIWLLPVFKSPSYHGYDTIDYYTVNPDYGTNDDLIRLNREVHRRHMHILLDYVVNHTSDQSPYFKDALGNPNSQYSDYYNWFDAQHTRYDYFASTKEMPTLNYHNQKTRQFAIDIALHWLDPLNNGDLAAGVDGYRCDVASGPPRDFWQQLRAAMTAKNPRSVLLGELWFQGVDDIAPYLGDGGLDAAFDFPLFLRLTGSPDSNGDGVLAGKGSVAITSQIIRLGAQKYADSAHMVRFINNHDTNRVMSDVNGDPARARAAAVFELTAPGTPILYYGEEIGMKGSKGGPPDYDKYRREPLDWYAALKGAEQTTWFTPADSNNKPNDGISVEEENGKADSLLTLYRTLGKLRAEHGALRSSSFDLPRTDSLPNDLYLLRHWDASELYLTLINFTEQPISFSPDAALWQAGGLRYTRSADKPMLDQGLSADGAAWTLQPAGYAIFRAAAAF